MQGRQVRARKEDSQWVGEMWALHKRCWPRVPAMSSPPDTPAEMLWRFWGVGGNQGAEGGLLWAQGLFFGAGLAQALKGFHIPEPLASASFTPQSSRSPCAKPCCISFMVLLPPSPLPWKYSCKSPPVPWPSPRSWEVQFTVSKCCFQLYQLLGDAH